LFIFNLLQNLQLQYVLTYVTEYFNRYCEHLFILFLDLCVLKSSFLVRRKCI